MDKETENIMHNLEVKAFTWEKMDPSLSACLAHIKKSTTGYTVADISSISLEHERKGWDGRQGRLEP